MAEPHPDGYRRHDRTEIGKREPTARVDDFEEIWRADRDDGHLVDQTERCMDCGVPTCMAGCPIGNAIPDWNDLVHRGDWRAALNRLHATNNFPEFTGYTCPAPCEPACVLAYNDDPVTIKDVERAIVDRGWEMGWIEPEPAEAATGYSVAIVGSGPAGLAAAQQLARIGHAVTVFERDDAVGGMMRYGIPDFKFAKDRLDRRVAQLEAEGVVFETNAGVGGEIPPEVLTDDFDAACLAVGARRPRDVTLPGRDLDGVQFAMEYLTQANRRGAGRPIERGIHAAGKHVVVLGGGDTGADCVATAHRQGAREVVQIEINPKPFEKRPPDNPWPQQPQWYRKTYAQEEGGEEAFGVETKAFVDAVGDGHVEYVEAVTRSDGDDLLIPADLVLIAVGFTGPAIDPFRDLGVERATAGTIATDERKMTAAEGVFAAGDATRGQSLVVWAIGEGRDVARHIDVYLRGGSSLPASLEAPNPPIEG